MVTSPLTRPGTARGYAATTGCRPWIFSRQGLLDYAYDAAVAAKGPGRPESCATLGITFSPSRVRSSR